VGAMMRTLTATGWLAVACLALALILLAMCVADGHQKADRRTAAAQDASAFRDSNDAANQSTRDQVKEDHDALRREIDPAVRDADARRRLCVLDPSACTA